MTKTVEIGEAREIESEEIKAIFHLQGNPVAQARLAKRLMDKHKDQSEVAKLLGVRQPWVSKLLRLVTLPEEILSKVEEGKMAASTAYLLTKLSPAERTKVLKQEKLVQADVAQAVRKAAVSDDLLDLVEAPAKTHQCVCKDCGRRL